MGDIRGRGLFWAIEFVADRVSKKPLDSRFNVAKRLGSTGLKEGYNISLFTASGSADGWHGDHFLLAPPYTVSATEVEEIVKRVCRVIEAVFDELGGKRKLANGHCEANGCESMECVDGIGH